MCVNELGKAKNIFSDCPKNSDLEINNKSNIFFKTIKDIFRNESTLYHLYQSKIITKYTICRNLLFFASAQQRNLFFDTIITLFQFLSLGSELYSRVPSVISLSKISSVCTLFSPTPSGC
jgi:hypothetical protein